jgi:hypothetical protein
MPVTTFRAPRNVGSARSSNSSLKVELDSPKQINVANAIHRIKEC